MADRKPRDPGDIQRRKTGTMDWIWEAVAGSTDGRLLSMRLSVEQRDALAALCIVNGGAGRSEVLGRLILEAARGLDIQAELELFIRTRRARAAVPAYASPLDRARASAAVPAPAPSPIPMPPPLPCQTRG